MRSEAITSLWSTVASEIPDEKIISCAWIAMTVGPSKNWFGPHDLLNAWRGNLRGPDGKPVRGVSV